MHPLIAFYDDSGACVGQTSANVLSAPPPGTRLILTDAKGEKPPRRYIVLDAPELEISVDEELGALFVLDRTIRVRVRQVEDES